MLSRGISDRLNCARSTDVRDGEAPLSTFGRVTTTVTSPRQIQIRPGIEYTLAALTPGARSMRG